MASTLIHYAISIRILEKIHVKDKFLFLMGASVGPDASSHDDGSYDTAHFWERTENMKGINWLVFANEYQTNILSNDFLIGYYCHLIQDAVWFHDIVDKYVLVKILTDSSLPDCLFKKIYPYTFDRCTGMFFEILTK